MILQFSKILKVDPVARIVLVISMYIHMCQACNKDSVGYMYVMFHVSYN
jgi:hypothetical protein